MKLIFKKKDYIEAKEICEKFKNSYKCILCKSTQDLTNHHLVPKKDGGKGKLNNTIRVCRKCHDEIHGFKTKKIKLEEMINKYIWETGNTDIQSISEDLEIDTQDVVMIMNPEHWENCIKKHQLRKLKEITKWLD